MTETTSSSYYIVKISKTAVSAFKKWLLRFLIITITLVPICILVIFTLSGFDGLTIEFNLIKLSHFITAAWTGETRYLKHASGLNTALLFASGNYDSIIIPGGSLGDAELRFKKYNVIDLHGNVSLYTYSVPRSLKKIEKDIIYFSITEDLVYKEGTLRKLIEFFKRPCTYLPPKEELENRCGPKDESKNPNRNCIEYPLLEARKLLECDVKKATCGRIRASVVPNDPHKFWTTELFAIEVKREDINVD